MDKIAVVILNYNGANFLRKFLPNVIEFSGESVIYVADNCSTDNSVQILKEEFPLVKLIINKSNGGFAKGYNDALKQIKATYYVLLNSDIEVTPNWVNPCVEMLDKNPYIAALQPKVLAYHEKDRFEHAGAAGGFLDKDFYPFCRGRIFENTEIDNGQYDTNQEVFWATGACLFIRAEKYHEVGGLDEDFFAHMEEIDLCWRLKRRGNSIFFCGESTIYHVGGGTLNYSNPQKTYLNFRNSLFMVTKNYHGPLFYKLFKRLVLDGIAACLFLIKFQFRHFIAVLNAHGHFYAKFNTFLKKRKIEKVIPKSLYNSKGFYKKSIILRSFLFGFKNFSQLKKESFN